MMRPSKSLFRLELPTSSSWIRRNATWEEAYKNQMETTMSLSSLSSGEIWVSKASIDSQCVSEERKRKSAEANSSRILYRILGAHFSGVIIMVQPYDYNYSEYYYSSYELLMWSPLGSASFLVCRSVWLTFALTGVWSIQARCFYYRLMPQARRLSRLFHYQIETESKRIEWVAINLTKVEGWTS